MRLHANAALSLNGRRTLVRRVVVEQWTLTQAAAAAEVSVRCARKWVGRYRDEGELGLLDRSSAPHHQPLRTDELRVQAIAALRRLRFTGPEVAEILGMAPSTVSGVLTRIGLARLRGLGPAPPPPRRPPYNPTTTKLGGIRRGLVRWEFVHIAIDDCTRLAYAEVLPDEKATTAVAFLGRAIAFYRRHGMTVEQLLTDNGSAYRATVHAIACRTLGIRHLRTRPRRPQTNGKAERVIRTTLAGPASRARPPARRR